MPPRIRTILPRVRRDLAACLSPEATREACRAAGHRWRDRALNPVTTVYLFLLRILHGNTACQHVVQFGIWKFSESAYCQARKRLPLAVFQKLLEQITAKLRQTTQVSSFWLTRHRVWIVDGPSFSMSDVEELQHQFGQPGEQRPGCGYPVAKFLALVDVATGMISRVLTARLRSHESSRVAQIHDALQVGDVLMGDCGFCSFAHLALLVQRRVHAVFRIHQQAKDLKITMEMYVLHCQTVEGVLKELAVFALAYNLVRSVMADAAPARGVAVIRISVQDTVRWLIGDEVEKGGGVSVIKVNRRRSGRVEPRVKKRRPKQYLRMTAPRSVLRKRLLEQNVAA